jgi:ABC-type transporter Mla subunit MlaD
VTDHLKLDLQLLDQLRDDLSAVVSEFKNADDFSDDVADATGHDDLAGHVRDFAHAWNEKRKSMTTNVENVQKAVAAITDNFTKVDQGLAKALEDSANSGSDKYPAPKPTPATASPAPVK